MKGSDEQLLTDMREKVEYIVLCAQIDSEFPKRVGQQTQDILDIFSGYLEEKGVDLKIPEIPLSERTAGAEHGGQSKP